VSLAIQLDSLTFVLAVKIVLFSVGGVLTADVFIATPMTAMSSYTCLVWCRAIRKLIDTPTERLVCESEADSLPAQLKT
jgi:hypothetical protein